MKLPQVLVFAAMAALAGATAVASGAASAQPMQISPDAARNGSRRISSEWRFHLYSNCEETPRSAL